MKEKGKAYKFRFFENSDPEFSIYLKSKGYLADFRAYLKRVHNQLQSLDTSSSDIVAQNLSQELDIQLEILSKEWGKIEKELSAWNRDHSIVSVQEGFIHFDIREEGYNVPSALKLIQDHINMDLIAPKVCSFINLPSILQIVLFKIVVNELRSIIREDQSNLRKVLKPSAKGAIHRTSSLQRLFVRFLHFLTFCFSVR